MYVSKSSKNRVFDAIHKGAVSLCVGISVIGFVAIGAHFFKYLWFDRPEKLTRKKEILLQEGQTAGSFDDE